MKKMEVVIFSILLSAFVNNVVADKDSWPWPIEFKLCATKQYFDGDLFESRGYEDDEKMYLGQSMKDKTRFGWAGHSDDESFIKSAYAMINETNIDWNHLLKSVEYDGVTQTNLFKNTKLQMVGGCIIFNPEDHFKYSEYGRGKELFFTIREEPTEYTINIYVLSRGQPVHRHLKTSHKSHLGSDVQLKTGGGFTHVKKYLLTPRYRGSYNTHPSVCSSSNMDDFAKCDKKATHNYLKEKYGVVPFWASNDELYEDVTQETVIEEEKVDEFVLDVWNIFDGTKKFDECLPLCDRWVTQVSRLADFTVKGKHKDHTVIFSLDYQI